MNTKKKQTTPTAETVANFFILIKGETSAGKKFRPSDWADRLFGAVASYVHYKENECHNDVARYVCIVERNGIKGIVIDSKLDLIKPNLNRFIHNFAHDNSLAIEKLDSFQWNSNRHQITIKPQQYFT